MFCISLNSLPLFSRNGRNRPGSLSLSRGERCAKSENGCYGSQNPRQLLRGLT